MKKLLFLSLLLPLFFSACKKDKNEDSSLKGKWKIESIVIKEYLGGSLSDTYTEPSNGATMDFQNNGHVVISYPNNQVESMTYIMKSDSKVDIDGDVYEIRNLTASSVLLFLRQDYAPGEYDEVYVNLKR